MSGQTAVGPGSPDCENLWWLKLCNFSNTHKLKATESGKQQINQYLDSPSPHLNGNKFHWVLSGLSDGGEVKGIRESSNLCPPPTLTHIQRQYTDIEKPPSNLGKKEKIIQKLLKNDFSRCGPWHQSIPSLGQNNVYWLISQNQYWLKAKEGSAHHFQAPHLDNGRPRLQPIERFSWIASSRDVKRYLNSTDAKVLAPSNRGCWLHRWSGRFQMQLRAKPANVPRSFRLFSQNHGTIS